ncbi:helix-turn-helix domain-containing protein [Desulfomicrobium salsuginis]
MLTSNVKKIMDSKMLRIKPFAEQNGFSHITILAARDRIETCKLGTLERLARALGVSVHDLFDDEFARK